MVWKDGSGKTLADYPHPSVAVDVAVLTVSWQRGEGQLCVLLHRATTGNTAGRWGLPGTFVRVDELLADAALRVLRDKVAVTGERPEQLGVFDAVDRDERGRVISVAHVDLVPKERLPQLSADCVLAPLSGQPVRAKIPGRQARLPYDHDRIVERAVDWARHAYQHGPDPHHLIGQEFTLYQLRQLHEAVLGDQTPHKDTFRRRMETHIVAAGRVASGSVGRPAELYRRRETDDP